MSRITSWVCMPEPHKKTPFMEIIKSYSGREAALGMGERGGQERLSAVYCAVFIIRSVSNE